MFDTGCCGSDMKQERISKWGVFSLIIPLLFLTGLLSLPLILLGVGQKTTLVKLLKACLKLVQRTQFLPALKCRVSSVFHKISPVFGGICFKNFSLILFISIWATFIILPMVAFNVL